MVAMKEDDVNEAAELHRRGVLNLRAAVWALAVFRRQGRKELTPAEVMERFGASRTNAYRVVAEMRFAIQETHRQFPETGNSGRPSPAGESAPPTHQHVPETGTGTHQRFPVSRNPGFPETGTEIPGNRDCSQYKGSRETESVCFTHAGAREGEAPNGPSPEPERRAAVRFVGDLTAGALEGWASQACRVYPAPWVRALAERKCIGATPRAQLLNAILQSWAGSGSCEYLAAPATPARAGSDHRPRRRGPDVDAMDFGGD